MQSAPHPDNAAGNDRRIVFFLQGKKVPASRMRGFQIAEALATAAENVSIRPCSPSVYGDTNLPLPFRRWRPLFYPFALACRLGQLRGLQPKDIVFFQRPMFEMPWAILEWFASRGHASVFDFDDAIYLNRFTGPKVSRIVDMVDHVIVGNSTLASFVGAPEKTTIIPTVINTDRFTPKQFSPSSNRGVLVGWTGLSSNYKQLAVAKKGIAAAMAKTGARFRVISDQPPPGFLDELKPEFIPWRADREVEDLAAIDIGVMPLPDSPYARGKCGFKLLQYMALGIPGVASPVGANSDILAGETTGYLAGNDQTWEARLIQLIEDQDARIAMGVAARAHVLANYSIRAVLPKYQAIFDRLRPR